MGSTSKSESTSACDRDDSDAGSISWEDFFGSSTDLVPTLLSMYDTLIAQTLSNEKSTFSASTSNGVNSNTSAAAPQPAGTATTTSSSKTSVEARLPSIQTVPTPKINGSLSHTNSSAVRNNVGNHATPEVKIAASIPNHLPPTPFSANNCQTSTKMAVSPLASNKFKTIISSPSKTRQSSTDSTSHSRYGALTRGFTRWSSRERSSESKAKKAAAAANASSGLLDLKLARSATIQRPLSINSTLSSTSSSSSCSSSGSASAPNPLRLAPRASPEEEDDITIPDVDLSEDEEEHCAKLSNNNNEQSANGSLSERCFTNSSSTNEDYTDASNPRSATNRVSHPIAYQGRPKFCDPNLSYMDRVVMEIVETERIYVMDLREIISGYLEHWRINPEEPLPADHLLELFNNIEEIHQFNSEFLTQLEGCGLNPIHVARCFVTKNEGFSIYTQYCTNYPRTMSLLTEMMRQEQSAKLFRERQAALSHTLPLGSYLLKPVQRILKYHLLLQNIVKHFDSEAEGYDVIVEALSAMTNIAHHINDMKRRHEHAVRVQEIQSLLYGWQGEDLTTYGELCAEGTFRMYGAKALRHVFLFDKMLLIAKKKEDGILIYKSFIMCSNLMLIESVPSEPLSFHVIPFDNPRLQCTLQARNLEHKREWTLPIKRVILENYHAVIPIHARQLVMELGQYRPEDEAVTNEKVQTKRQHSAPEYLERRKQEKERRKAESSLKAKLRRTRKNDPINPKSESPAAVRRGGSRRPLVVDSTPINTVAPDNDDQSGSGGTGIDRKMSSASCPPSGTPTSEQKLVKKLSGWRRKSEPGFYTNGVKSGKTNGSMSPAHDTSISTLDSTESIGEEEYEGEEDESCSSHTDLCIDDAEETIRPHVEERRESVEEIVGQLVMQNFEFQRILSKQRLAHLRKTITQHQQRHLKQSRLKEEESASDTETEESVGKPRRRKIALTSTTASKRAELMNNNNGSSNCTSGSQVSSSANGIGSSTSDMNENSTENINNVDEISEELIVASKNVQSVQRTVSDPGNKATLTPRRFANGPLAHYDPLSLLWSSFRRGDNNRRLRPNYNNRDENEDTKSNSKGRTNIRHTHSFTCSRKESAAIPTLPDPKETSLPHGDSGVFPNSFTSDSSSSSEANIPTLPAVWLKQQGEHLATPNNKSGSLPRSFQVGQHQPQSLLPSAVNGNGTQNDDNSNVKSRVREVKYADRPFTIASDKPSPSDMSLDEMEEYMSKFNDEVGLRSSQNTTAPEDIDDFATELTPITSMENISRHPDHKIYHSSNKSSIKHILLSVTQRLAGLKANMMMVGVNNSHTNLSSPQHSNNSKLSIDSLHHTDKCNDSTGSQQLSHKTKNGGNNIMSRHGRKSLRDKMKNLVKEGADRDSDSENCESITCGSSVGGSSGFGSLGSSGSSSNNLIASSKKIGARLAQCSENSDYTLCKLLASASLNDRPNSVMSVSSTVTSSSSTDEKNGAEVGLGESSTTPNTTNGNGSPLFRLRAENPRYFRKGRKDLINQKNLYLSYVDQEAEAHSDSDASADSFYERSFEAIESLLENEIFPDSAIYSDQEDYCASSNSPGSIGNNWSLSPTENPAAVTKDDTSISGYYKANYINMLPPSVTQHSKNSGSSNDPRRSRLIRSQMILEKLKHLEECTRFQRDGLPSPSFEGLKTIQERRKELDSWKVGNREDESETSSQHSTSTINTVIEMSPSKSTTSSFPSSRRCSDTESSGGNSPLTERAISSASSRSMSQGNVGDPMPKGWVKLLVTKLEGEES